MARILYSLLLYLLSPLVVFYLYVLRGKKNKGYREHFAERFGFSNLSHHDVVFHCASVGEVLAATPLIKAVQSENPTLTILVTCNTPTGREQIKNNFKDAVSCCYLPIDFFFATKRFLKRIQPKVLCILETELWPNLMAQSNNNGTKVLVLNARLSAKSQQGYQKVMPLTKVIMHSISDLASHNQDDAKRFIELGLKPEKARVFGSIKFDIMPTDEQLNKVAALKNQYNNERFIWVAGSTHPIEHELILTAHKKLLKALPNALLIIAPRHPEQFDKVVEILKSSNLSFSRRSEDDYNKQQVVLADTLGELQCLYGVANISYVGGSLIERGGHNPLESAAFSVGVLAGPHTYNFDHIYPELISAQGAKTVTDENHLADTLIALSSDVQKTIKLGQQAQKCVTNNQGAISKTVNLIEHYLEK
ncbi:MULTISPECIES: lipid IV(A) 3-deoxy-D-manno-octulosonic acid transferase [unclassified Pseudoalteromonas]|uniref:lipid IV(A) 3-deoxy-D-manno-octulosonic acid transferase n=1 Tax=unclassified Pseudoalteromonas TaxID=194690 RepID=UPI00110A8D8E|nr:MULTISPECIES: lipid IV(A) 3-deoxy-D-manno-octulosonic acid transferase [unclassified Pseudoalteromonas]TMP47602.1 3-deoxy-D-manno-octulosonic acid transferase [Pseudoalteromonas sp. S1650]TMP67918.1 3-deoxy-D-manno-octulosonic acid transferase [Pseudoalteromonas sp. S1649]